MKNYAIDFTYADKEEDSRGDRIKITMPGKSASFGSLRLI